MTEADKSAFPVSGVEIKTEWGLTKREYFAAMAMQGLCANSDWAKTIKDDWDEYADRIAEASSSLSDSLIKELNK